METKKKKSFVVNYLVNDDKLERMNAVIVF